MKCRIFLLFLEFVHPVSHENTEFEQIYVFILKKSINFLSQRAAFRILLYFVRVQDCDFLSRMCGYH